MRGHVFDMQQAFHISVVVTSGKTGMRGALQSSLTSQRCKNNKPLVTFCQGQAFFKIKHQLLLHYILFL